MIGPEPDRHQSTGPPARRATPAGDSVRSAYARRRPHRWHPGGVTDARSTSPEPRFPAPVGPSSVPIRRPDVTQVDDRGLLVDGVEVALSSGALALWAVLDGASVAELVDDWCAVVPGGRPIDVVETLRRLRAVGAIEERAPDR